MKQQSTDCLSYINLCINGASISGQRILVLSEIGQEENGGMVPRRESL